jgi:hypothetical protein
MPYYLLLLLAVILIQSCQPGDPAQRVVDKSIAYYGGKAYDAFSVEFDFRNIHYLVERDNGKFRYERVQKDSTGAKIKDILTNQEAYRTVNGERQTLPDSTMDKYRNSVNSVAYFLLLPQPLQDPAVHKEYLGEVTIKGKTYDKVKVYFEENGGGKDHDDVFVYWFDKEDASIDYLAYLYHVNETGMRFREAYNPQQVGGMRFQDYINYSPVDSTLAVTDESLVSMDQLFQAGKLKELSRIENKNFVIK